MEVVVITDVTEEPVTLDEIKDFCHIDQDYAIDDAKLSAYITSARELLEKELNLSLAPKVLEWQYGGASQEIPYGPVGEIVSLKTSSDVLVDPTVYNISGLAFKSIRINDYSGCYIIYPVGYTGAEKAYNLTYNAGYETLPCILLTAIKMQVDYWVKNLGAAKNELTPDVKEMTLKYSRNLYIQ